MIRGIREGKWTRVLWNEGKKKEKNGIRKDVFGGGVLVCVCDELFQCCFISCLEEFRKDK
jgi:hypothetical protein